MGVIEDTYGVDRFGMGVILRELRTRFVYARDMGVRARSVEEEIVGITYDKYRPGSKQKALAYRDSLNADLAAIRAEKGRAEERFLDYYEKLGAEQFFPERYITDPDIISGVAEVIADQRADTIGAALNIYFVQLAQQQQQRQHEEMMAQQRAMQAESRRLANRQIIHDSIAGHHRFRNRRWY